MVDPLEAVAEHESTTCNSAEARGVDGRVDDPEPSSDDASWERVEALAVAVQALLAAGLAGQARPLVDELVEVARAARPAGAAVVSIDRAKRR